MKMHVHRFTKISIFLIVLLVIVIGLRVRRSSLDTQLVEAVKRGDVGAAIQLLDSGANANTDANVETGVPFNQIILRGLFYSHSTHPEKPSRSVLLASMDWPDDYYDKTIVWADASPPIVFPKEEIMLTRALLQHGADLNVRNGIGSTPLMIAVTQEKSDTVQLLLANGAKVNSQQNDGYTALMYAISGGDTKIIQILLDSHADVNRLRNKQGYTALSLAEVRHDAEIVKVLKRYLPN